MLQFTDPFKIYLFKHRQQVTLSIRVSNHVVDTYRFEQSAFEQLLSACEDRQGRELDTLGVNWFAQHKHVGKLTEYVRISAWVAGACRDYRADTRDISELREEYLRQLANTMPWD